MSVVGSAGTVSFKFAVEGIDQVLQGFNLMEQGQKKLTTSVETMRTSLGTAISSALPVGFQQIGEGADQAATKTQTFTQRMQGFQGNLLTAATSVGTFTASIFGIDAAMDQLTASEISLEQARVRQDRMQVTLQAQEQKLNELRTSGTATAAEIAVQEERVNTTRQQTEVQTERVNFMQQNLNEQYAQFGSQILPQVITASLSGVTAITSLFQLVGKSEKATGLLNKAWSALSTAFASTNITPLTGALSNATQQTSAFHSGLTLIPTVLGVIGASVAIAGTAIALFATNAFGARDAMFATGEAIGNAIPPLEGFLNALEHSGRLWVNILEGPVIFKKTIGEMAQAVDSARAATNASLEAISQGLDAFTTNAQLKFEDLGTGYEQFAFQIADDTPYVKATAGSQILVDMIDLLGKKFQEGHDISQEQLSTWAIEVSNFSTLIAKSFQDAGEEVPTFISEIQRLANELRTQLVFDPDKAQLTFEQLKTHIQGMLLNLKDTVIKWGPDFEKSIQDIFKKTFDPIGFNVSEIQAKLNSLKLPPELAITTSRFTENIQGMTEAWLTNFTAGTQSEQQLRLIAQTALPELVKGYQVTNKEIDTENEFLQLLVNSQDTSKKSTDALTQGLLAEADARGIKKQVTEDEIEVLTEEEQKLANLAKAYFDLTLTTSDQILEKKAQIEWVENAIEKYDDEIESLKELQIEYGANEQAVYGVNQATQDLITSKKDQIIQLQEETLGHIDVTKALDGSKESQILLNEAMIEGKTAAADFVTELAKAEKQTEAYGKALSDNVLKILEEMPDAIGKLAEELKTTLPKTFESLSQFEGMIKPFDKDSIKEYKDFLKEMDVPKDIKKLAIKAADIWQDKDEIIKETEAIFGAMSGIMANSFEELDASNVTSFLDEIENKVTEMEDLGIDANLTQPLRDLIEHIRTSSDPLKEFYMHFEELQGAMDPKAFSDVNFAMQMFGDELVLLVQSATLGDFVLMNENLATAFERIAGSGAPEAIAAYVKAAQEWNASVAKQMGEGGTGGFMLLNEAQEEANKQGYGPEGAEKGAGPEDMAKAWEDAKVRIVTATTGITTAVDTATAQISLSVAQMAATVGTAILANVKSIDGLQTMWMNLDTNLKTYTGSMTTSVQTTTDSQAANMLLIGKGIDALKTLNSEWSQIVTEATGRMTDDVQSMTDSKAANFLLIGRGIDALKTLWAELSQIVTEASSRMTTDIEEWSEATVKAFKAVETGAGTAKTAVEGLADAIKELKDKKVTITVDVQENSTSSGSNAQYGGAKLLTHPQYIFGGEGHKPELHLTFPLDQMAQSHAKDAFRLPFNIGDLTTSKMAPPSFTGSTSNQAYVPSNLVSNLRLNANLHIDLGNEVRKIVREEINARAVTRLDRMAM